MDKTTEIASKNIQKPNIFLSENLPKIKQVLEEIKLGTLSQQKAADRYGVTRYQVRKWWELFNEEGAFRSEEEFTDEYQQKVVREVHTKGLRLHDACKKFGVPLDTLRRWLRNMPGLRVLAPKRKRVRAAVKEGLIENIIKIETAHKVQTGELSQFKAARDLRVTRYTIRKWISKYPINLEEENSLQIMASEEKLKELEKELERLKKELEREKLRSEGLNTLIEVAEEKFGIKIKKKPGSQQPKE